MGQEPITFNHYMEEIYGFSEKAQAEYPLEERKRYAQAILVAVSADGKLSEGELRYFLGYMKALGTSDKQLAEFQQFDPSKVDLLELVKSMTYIPARSLIYDVIKVASADGYHEKEKAAVQRLAQLLEVPGDMVLSLEGIVEAEASLRASRAHVFSFDLPDPDIQM